jgi:hypothetical protein
LPSKYCRQRSQPDLGTAFALATSLYGSNRLQFSANMGYASQSGLPAAGFRTTFSRQMDSGLSPEVTVTMRQLFLPQRAAAYHAYYEHQPLRRTSMSFDGGESFSDAYQISDQAWARMQRRQRW